LSQLEEGAAFAAPFLSREVCPVTMEELRDKARSLFPNPQVDLGTRRGFESSAEVNSAYGKGR